VPDVVRWGILGAANIASWQFTPAVRASRRGVLAAVAARDLGRARAFAAGNGVERALGSYEELLADPGIDAVYIGLPNALHAPWTIRAAMARKHVLCEKPWAASAAEGLEAVRACERAGVVHAEAFVYRCHPQTLLVRRWLDGGAIGEVRGVHAAFHFVMPPERRAVDIRMRADLAGGALMDVGCYPVSWLRFVFGAEPLAATAAAVFERGVDTHLAGMLHFAGGRAGTLSGSFDAPGTLETRIAGTGGEIVVSQPYHPRGPGATAVLRRNGAPEEVRREARDEPPFLAAVEHFHDRVLDGVPALLPGRDALGNMAAIDALLSSARAGGTTVPVIPPAPSALSPEGRSGA
jgi:xylose dehydrogenase (NAD/NADP)